MSQSSGAAKQTKAQSESTSPATIKSLIANLAAKDWRIRLRARQSLVNIGAKAVPLLTEAQSNPSLQVRWEVAKALGEIRDPAAAYVLVKVISEEAESFDVRWVAAEALVSIGRGAVVPLLNALIANPSSEWLHEGAHHILSHLAGKDRPVEHHELHHLKISYNDLEPALLPVVTALESDESYLQTPVAAKIALNSLKSQGKV